VADVLTKEQIAELRGIFIAPGNTNGHKEQVRDLCDSHESLRARIAELEGNGEGSVAGANRRVGYIMGDLELARKQVAALSSQLAAAREQVEQAAHIIERLMPLGTITDEDIAWARAALDGLGEKKA
jgi:hypothetical protein